MSNRELLADMTRQHDALRHLVQSCEVAAWQVERSGAGEGRPLVRAVLLLLDALSRHNVVEEHCLRQVLLEADAFGEVRAAQMLEDHIAEQVSILECLRDVVLCEGDAAGAVHALRTCLGQVRDYLAAEERQFLNDQVVRDDLVAIDATDG